MNVICVELFRVQGFAGAEIKSFGAFGFWSFGFLGVGLRESLAAVSGELGNMIPM